MTQARRLDFSDVFLYAVTPEMKDSGVLVDKVEKLLAGGVDAIQFRTRHLSDRDYVATGRKIKEICAEHGALFLVNNRVDLALALDSDGVHVGHTDLPVSTVRGLFGHRKIIGASTHSLAQALDAQRQGADYVSCGPIWSTPTKPEYDAVGLKLPGFYRAALKVPFVAIGGIEATNLDEVLEAGATKVAVVRYLFDAADPEQAARALKEKILKVQKALV